MANSVSMTTQDTIRTLRKRGYSKRKIARELGVHRKTVDNYLGGDRPPEHSKCTIPTPGRRGVRASVKFKPGKEMQEKVAPILPQLQERNPA
jgi:predicted transcriptional regulator